jgi:hypothetical protein
MNRILSALLVALILVSVAFPSLAQVPGTTEELQTWLTNPWVLFGLMIFGSVISAVKQWSVAKMDGTAVGVGLGAYLSHLQELFITLGGNAIAFFALVDSGNLNFVAAVSIGYVINSAADLSPLGQRSSSLTQK